MRGPGKALEGSSILKAFTYILTFLLVGFLSWPWCCCGASRNVSEVAKPSCCAKLHPDGGSAPNPGDAAPPKHECRCSQGKAALPPVDVLIPENVGVDASERPPVPLQLPVWEFAATNIALGGCQDLAPPPPIRQLFCVLLL